MATYKVIQDIEAEDKLVGPLTLRQFIYAGVAAVSLYVCFLALTKGAPFLLGIFLPIAAGAGFFGFPWKGEQPTEIWALARVRFMLKPRVRIWDQDGAKDLVRIIAPRPAPIRRNYKADMTQTEVHSRLKALADTIDSRGWATRNAAYGSYRQPWQNATAAPPESPLAAAMPGEDMFDDQSTVAQNFSAMLNKSQVQQRQRVQQQMVRAQNPMPPQPAPVQQYAYSIPQLPAPVMPAMPQAFSARPQPMYPSAIAPATSQSPIQIPQSSNGYWFASGPAYPATPTPQTVPTALAMPATPPISAFVEPPAASIPVPSLPAPVSTLEAIPPMPLTSTSQPALQQTDDSYDNSQPIGGSHIESDVPLPVAATPTNDDAVMGQAIKEQNEAAMAINYGHMRVLRPADDQPIDSQGSVPIDYAGTSSQPGDNPAMDPAAGSQASVTRPTDPAILNLANNDDLDIATIARQAKKEIGKSPDEVEIRLH